jgi:hypothetical protein
MKIKSLTLALGIFATTILQAQTADEIVNKHIGAMGGAAKVSSLKSVKMSGNMSTQGLDIPITLTKLHMKGLRIDMDINGTSNYRVANSTAGTVFMPITGATDPVAMEDGELKNSVRQMDVQGALYDYKSKGTTIELSGKEVVDGSEAYKLKVTYKDGEFSNFFIDTKSSFIVKTTSQRTINGQTIDVENSFSNYKQNADGYWFPYTITNQQAPINFDKIETNIALEESFFK